MMSTLEENDGRERPGGKAGRGSENKVPIVAAISLNAAGHSIQAKISPVAGFTSEALADWARQHLSSCCSVLSDGLATFHAFNFDKYVTRHLGGFCFLFDRRFKMAAMTERIANAVCVCKRCPERALRVAELYA